MFWRKYTFLSAALASSIAAATLMSSCESKTGADPTPEKSSFDLIQERIFDARCATSGCHASEADNSFREHKLVLAAGKAYDNLMNVAPTNVGAKGEGWLRVKPFKSLESYLYHKLNFDASHHGGKQYGSPMPLGGNPVSVGQLEFVRRWIEAGSPKTGSVVDATLLDDTTPGASATFTALEVPKAGEGFQLSVERFEVAGNFERELFVRKAVGNTTDIYVNRVVLKGRQNSHHLVIYDFRDKTKLPVLNQVRDLRNPDKTLNLSTVLSMQNHVFMAGGSQTNQEYVFPEGTALMLPAGASVDLNPHYFNKTGSIIYGENYANLYTVDKSKVKNVVQMLDLGNQDLTLPAKTKTTLRKSFTSLTSNGPVNVVMLTSHMHKLGEKFVIKIKGGSRDGQIVYETDSWEHPTVLNFPTPLRLEKGEGLTSEITYNNTTSNLVRFGLTSEDEMGIIFGYYYEIK